MNSLKSQGFAPVVSDLKKDGSTWTVKEKIMLGLSPKEYWAVQLRNPFNWLLWAIYAIGLPILVGRFIFGLGWVTHSSYDYPWGLFLGWGLFVMVPLSASGFMMGTTVELFGRKDFKPIERLGLLNGLLGYTFAVMFLQVDLGQPWRLIYPMFVSLGPAAVLFLVAWHVATYLSCQVAELVPAFSEWMGFPKAKKFIKSIVLGLTVAGIILSTLHQGALGALFTYAPGKVHPLWYSSPFQWLHFFVSAVFAGLSMLIVVSTLTKWFMRWRCDENYLNNLSKLTLGLAKGASLALITYLVIKIIGIAHDNNWAYLLTGWGAWFMFEMVVGVILPLIFYTMAVRNSNASLARFAAFMAVFGLALNRLNTALISFNWQLYQELPHWREVVIVVTVYATYIVVYRAVLARMPILYTWKEKK
ncbi:NrfD/PsrC family molybdoenzyme membrane anchor subunit [Thiovibrio frasassiensis]|uniref:Polysulfide reductase NrfD n=1 Tax=Thiovibrio frasassiensis TaxID=2984131 RepID=A0A9X4MGA8_9BACT|nr:NrfD/PsrC family molybdoenzyme membrane anchor subunit [Thiovibrio frasassiensis]MDG4476097.1 polysulfide reductase NrfD [Thiovibrio frasassiensis]